MGTKLTHEEFAKRLYKLNPNLEILTEYTLSNNPMVVRCKVCNDTMAKPASQMLAYSKCTNCDPRGSRKKVDEQEFLKRLSPKYDMVDEYIDYSTKIRFKCKQCGNIITKSPCFMIHHDGCKYCYYMRRKELVYTDEEFKKMVYEKNKNIKILGTYAGSQSDIKCECLIDGHIWETKASRLHHGVGCPRCGGSLKKTNQEFLEEMEIINSDIEILGEYTSNKTKLKVRCKLDDNVWEQSPNHLLRGIGCPVCANTKRSKGEEKIKKFLEENEISYTHQKWIKECHDKLTLPFDFCVYDDNGSTKFLIEYDGIGHFKPIRYSYNQSENDAKIVYEGIVRRDHIKNEYCKMSGTRLVRMPYFDFKNIETILSKELDK